MAVPAYFSVKILWGLLAGIYSKNCAARRTANPNPQNATASDCGRFFSILVVVQQIANTLAARQINPDKAHGFELVWMHFGHADDEAQLRAIRLK